MERVSIFLVTIALIAGMVGCNQSSTYIRGQCDVGGWTGINQTAAGTMYTVGLKADGTVVAVGWNNRGQCNVG